jgi:hypothetical protein
MKPLKPIPVATAANSGTICFTNNMAAPSDTVPQFLYLGFYIPFKSNESGRISGQNGSSEMLQKHSRKHNCSGTKKPQRQTV